MTVSSEINRSGPYPGNGVTTVFDYDFRIRHASHLRVFKTDDDGTETVLTLTTHYTVNGVGGAGGGDIVLAAAPPSTSRITILRHVPFTQETDLENQGPYFAETIEAALDLSAMRDQQLQEEMNRTVKIPVASTDLDVETLAEDIFAAQASVIELSDEFNSRYLGEHTTFPATDNNGNPLVNGALVSMSGQPDPDDDGMYAWRDGGWQQIGVLPAAFQRFDQITIATGGQTSVPVAGNYVPGQIVVFLNGIKVELGASPESGSSSPGATASDGATIVFPAGVLEVGHKVEWIITRPFNVATLAAADVPFLPGAGIGASNVQSALIELGTEKADTSNAVTHAELAAAVAGALAGIEGANSPFRISATVAGNNLTIALKTVSGADPTALAPLVYWFRDASGGRVKRTLTAPLSLVINNGSTMGVLANNAAFGLRPILLDDGGTLKIGVMNCRSDGAVKYITSLRPDGLIAATAEGTGAADNPGVVYASAAIATSPYIVLGSLEWDTGLTAIGVWSLAPTRSVTYAPGQALPGDVMQTLHAVGAGSVNGTVSFAIPTGGSQVIALSRPQNAVRLKCSASASIAATATAFNPSHQATLFRNAVDLGTTRSLGLSSGAGGINQNVFGSVAMDAIDFPLSSAAQTYSMQHRSTVAGINANTTNINLIIEEVCAA